MKEQISEIIRKAITLHLVKHTPTTDPRDRIEILLDEASREIVMIFGIYKIAESCGPYPDFIGGPEATKKFNEKVSYNLLLDPPGHVRYENPPPPFKIEKTID